MFPLVSRSPRPQCQLEDLPVLVGVPLLQDLDTSQQVVRQGLALLFPLGHLVNLRVNLLDVTTVTTRAAIQLGDVLIEPSEDLRLLLLLCFKATLQSIALSDSR